MSQNLRALARLLVVPTAALLVVVAFVPGRTGLAVRIYGLVVCASVLWLALGALRRSVPPARPLLPKPRAIPVARPASLVQLENEVALAAASAFDLHHRLRPHVRSLAAGLLASRASISLDRGEAARQALGEAAWELVRPDRPPPEDRLARGLPPASLAQVVESLERI